MVSKRPKGWRVSAAALAGLALSVVVVEAAADVGPPNGGGEHAAVVIDPTVLDRYVGFYKMSDVYVFTITRQGDKLFAKLTGQGAAQIYPESETKFAYKIVKAQIDFVADSSGNISSLVFHQNGVDHTATRVDEAVADQVDASLKARIQAQTPMPGSEAAVRSLLAGEASGQPDYGRMSPELAGAVRKQLPNIQAAMAPLGAVLSVEFESVGTQGWDTYLIKHEHGVSQVKVMLNAKGVVVGAIHTAGP
jgi:hypothetical protein